jgi:ACS family hexuronate transporter-like MFS transporter
LAPYLGVKIAKAYGWQMAFEVLGAVGVVWLIFWFVLYRSPKDHPKLSESEYAYIHKDDTEFVERISYSQLFGMRPVYGLAIAKALTDGPWWFILLWLPKILVDQFHVSVDFMALALPVVYVIGDVGSVGGGWFSSALLKKGWSVNRARKAVMLGSAACVLPVSSVGFLVDRPAIAGISCVFWAVGILAIAAAAHQSWSSNLFTVISDTVPKNSMAMAVGAINGFAMVGVSAMQFFVGRMVQLTSSYTVPFMVAGCLYLVGFVFLHLFIPNIEPYPTVRRAKIPWVVAGTAAILVCLGYMLYATNRPPYFSVADYISIRQKELKATGPPVEGPAAQVRWMQSRWYAWHLPTGKTKLELVKLDTHGQPWIEEKGDKANKYVGPVLKEVSASTH